MTDLAIELRERDEEGRGSWEVLVVGAYNRLPLVGVTEEADGSYRVFNWKSGDDEETHGETGDEFFAQPFMADEPDYEAVGNSQTLPDEDLANGLMMVAMTLEGDLAALVREAAFRIGESVSHRTSLTCKYCGVEIRANGVRDGRPDYLRVDSGEGWSLRFCSGHVYGQEHEPLA